MLALLVPGLLFASQLRLWSVLWRAWLGLILHLILKPPNSAADWQHFIHSCDPQLLRQKHKHRERTFHPALNFSLCHELLQMMEYMLHQNSFPCPTEDFTFLFARR